MDDKAYFWSHVVLIDDCLEWTGTRTAKGYGHVSRGGQSTTAQRWAWKLFMGKIPHGYVVDHLCRNHGCVNVEHLEPVPPAVNSRRGARDNPYWGPRPGNDRGDTKIRQDSLGMTWGKSCG